MHIRRYSLAALIFMGLTFAYVFLMVSKESVSIDLFGIHLPQLPVALWVVLPVVVLYFFTVLHLMYTGFIGGFKLRKYQKDYETLLTQLNSIYLKKNDKKTEYKTERYQVLSNALENTTLAEKESFTTTGNPKIDTLSSQIAEVFSGKTVDIKKFNLEIDNPIRIKNDLNRLENGDINSENILSKSDKFSKEVCKAAYIKFVETSPLYAIEQYKEYMSKKTLTATLERVNSGEYGFEASNESLLNLFAQVELVEEEYIDYSALLATHMIPDQRIKLFELLSDANENAMEAYLYTLYDVEMIDKAAEIIDNAQDDEFIAFRAYRSLREHNQNYNINLFTNKLCS